MLHGAAETRRAVYLALTLAFGPGLARVAAQQLPAAPPEAIARPQPERVVVHIGDDPEEPEQLLQSPTLVERSQPPALKAATPAKHEQPLPINLPTALLLSNARPLVIAAAEAGVEQAAAQLQGARVLWLPNLSAGFDYYFHDGADQKTEGNVIWDNRQATTVGGGATLSFGVTDAIFRPLAARQELLARQHDLQTARNDALFAVAASYFDVQEARGRLAANLDAVEKADELVSKVSALAQDLVPEMEIDRARTQLLDLRQLAAASRANWRVASAKLTRVLRLNPSSVVVPVEPPHLQVTMIAADSPVDGLIPIGLLNRPELDSQRALVQATLQRLRQERLRPLIPSVVLQGRGPGGSLMGGAFSGGPSSGPDVSGGRVDLDMGVVWTLNNLGLGNRSQVRERAAQQQKAVLEFFNVQDQVAQEVVQAHAQVEATAAQVREAETGVKSAVATYTGTLRGLGQARGAGNLLQLVSRPQEAVAALQQLNRAYEAYFATVNSYNRAQFQLYHALGFPARVAAVERPGGELLPVDDSRPPQMAPVCPHTLSEP